MRIAPLLLLAACHAPSPAPPSTPAVVQVGGETPAPAPGRTDAPCVLEEKLAMMSHTHRSAELTATYPAFRCAADHPRDRRLAEVNERLIAATRARFDDFLARLPIDLPPDAVTLDRHCRADTATPDLISVLCADTIAGLHPEPRSHFETLNLRITGHRVQPFTVWNIVRDDARPHLLMLLGDALREAGASRHRGTAGAPPASLVNVFTVTDQGLWFHFREGEVGAVNDGTYLIELPWSDLRPSLSETYLMDPLRRMAEPHTCAALGGICRATCPVGFLETVGTCGRGVCCAPDTSIMSM